MAKSSENPVAVSTRMTHGVRENKEHHARKLAERTRLEQEARDVTEFVLDRLALQGGLASLTLKSSAKGSPLKSEPAPEKLKKENDECSGCFFVLGVGAVSFGCGHANCPDCQLAITTRKKLFGSNAGFDLASSFEDFSSTQNTRKPRRNQSQTSKGPTQHLTFPVDSEGSLLPCHDRRIVHELDTMTSSEIRNTEDIHSQSPESSSDKAAGDLDLSFEVGHGDLSDSSDSDGEADRKNARTLRTKSKKVYTFEIEPASDDESVDDDEDDVERALEMKMTTLALQQQENMAKDARQALLSSSGRQAEQAKLVMEAIAAKRKAASRHAARTRRADTFVSSLESSTHRLSVLKTEIVETMECLKQGGATLSDTERQEMIERLFRLQQDLETMTGAVTTETSISDLASEGLKLLKALPDKDAENVLFSIVFGDTLLSKALVRHAGNWYDEQRAVRLDLGLGLDLASIQDRSRPASPSSTLTSMRTWSIPSDRIEQEEELEALEEPKNPHGLLDVVEQVQLKLVQPCEDSESCEKIAAAATEEAAVVPAVKKGTDSQAKDDKKPRSRSSFFGFGGTKNEEARDGTDKKESRMKSVFGPIFGSTKTEGVVLVVEQPKEPDMPAEAANALTQIAEAKFLLELKGKEKDVMQIAEKCSALLESHLSRFQDHENSEKLCASLIDGVKLCGEAHRAARESLLLIAEENLHFCGEFEAHNEIVQAISVIEQAMNTYSSLGMEIEASNCSTKRVCLEIRLSVQPFIKDGMKQIEERKFRTAVSPLEEGKRILESTPKEIQEELGELIQEIEEHIEHCRTTLNRLRKFGPRYWKKAQHFHGQDSPEAQSKASVLYGHAANAFLNVQELRAEKEARRLQKLTADNVMVLAVKKSQSLEIMDRFDDSIEMYDWLTAWLKFCERPQDLVKVDHLQRGVYNQRANTRLRSLTSMCDDGLRQLRRGYEQGTHLLELIQEDLSVAHCDMQIPEEQSLQISILNTRLVELKRISEMWLEAERIDPKTNYDRRMVELAKIKKQVEARGNIAGDRLIWDMNNFLRSLADQRRYQTGMVGVQNGADSIYDNAVLELRKLRAHMQLTFDDCQDEAGREHIQEMARICRAQFAEASETYENCEAWEKVERVVGVLGDVEFELGRWLLRQDDLRTRLKELTAGRRMRAREKLEREFQETKAESCEITAEDVSREICKVDAQRKIQFGQLEEGKMDYSRAQILYEESLQMLKGVDGSGVEAAANMLKGLDGREFEFEEMIVASNLAARNLWDERAAMLCRQANKRPERMGGPSRSQFDGDVASKAPAVMRESIMASYGGRLVFRPTFDTDPLLSTQRAEGKTHAVNLRPLNERTWLHTNSLYNPTPGSIALAKFTESLAPMAPTTKTNFFARPRANMSAGLVNAPESENPDYRVLPVGPANRPRPPDLDSAKF